VQSTKDKSNVPVPQYEVTGEKMAAVIEKNGTCII